MNSISSVIGRVPNLLSSQMMVGSINRSNSQLLQLQMQLASGRAVNRASEDPVASGTISVLDDLVERREQRVRNLSEAGSLLGTIDAALSEMGDLLLEAKFRLFFLQKLDRHLFPIVPVNCQPHFGLTTGCDLVLELIVGYKC